MPLSPPGSRETLVRAAQLLSDQDIDPDAAVIDDYSGRHRYGRVTPALTTSAPGLQASYALAAIIAANCPPGVDIAQHLAETISNVPASSDQHGKHSTVYYP